MLNSWSIKQKLYIALGFMLFAMLLLGFFSISAQNKLNGQGAIYTGLAKADSALLQARLSQADYMITEDPQYREEVYLGTEKSREILQELYGLMAVEASKSQVEEIMALTKNYESAFDNYTKTKEETIQFRDNFNALSEVVDSKINMAMNSIADHFNNNRDDFSEFTRYKLVKDISEHYHDISNDIRLYNIAPSIELEEKIKLNINMALIEVEEAKGLMLSTNTIKLLDDLILNMYKYLKRFKLLVENLNKLHQSEKNMLLEANQASEKTEALQSVEATIAQQVQEASFSAIVSGVVISILIGMFMGVWITRSIMGPLTKTVQFARQLAEGDLTRTVEVNSKDEFADMISALNLSVRKLNTIIVQTVSNVESLSQGGITMSSSANKSHTSTAKQLSSTDFVASAMSELSLSATEIADSTVKAVNLSNDGLEISENGSKVVTRSVKLMNTLANDMQSAADSVSELAGDVDNISTILEVIRGIADQTNLLALNAAIEAARAGEQGRGFSVVADEVRMLAKKTQDSIENITDIIGQLQKRSSGAVKNIDAAKNGSKDMLELSDSSGAAYEKIVEIISQIDEMNTQISVASEEQTRVAEKISANIVAVRDSAKSNTIELEQVTEIAGEQQQQLRELLEHVAFFKVDNSNAEQEVQDI